MVNNDTLVLKNLQRKHIGEYWCSATNDEGRGVSNKINLKIQCKSTFSSFLSFFRFTIIVRMFEVYFFKAFFLA